MPAINPPRLRIQANELAQKASDPDAFCSAFHEFLDFYADRTYRPGLVGEPRPLLRAYQVPPPVTRAVDKALNDWAGSNRKEAFKLADALWDQPILEFRLTAATLIGQIHPIPQKPIISRIESWVQPSTEERLIDALINSGLARLLVEYQGRYTSQVDTWLRARNLDRNRLGLLACLPLVEQRDFEDYPILFKHMSRFMRYQKSPLRKDILTVIEAMAHQAPKETAFFLENTIKSSGGNEQISWYLRRSIDFFPADIRAHLRIVLVG